MLNFIYKMCIKSYEINCQKISFSYIKEGYKKNTTFRISLNHSILCGRLFAMIFSQTNRGSSDELLNESSIFLFT